MDNFKIDVTACGEKSLDFAIAMAFNHNAPSNKVSHYFDIKLKRETRYYGEPKTTHHFSNLKESIDGLQTLILLWSGEPKCEKFPYAMELEETQAFVKGWLKRADLGSQPDHDGDNGKGWRVFTEAWGHVAGHSYSVCAIQPQWAMYGK